MSVTPEQIRELQARLRTFEFRKSVADTRSSTAEKAARMKYEETGDIEEAETLFEYDDGGWLDIVIQAQQDLKAAVRELHRFKIEMKGCLILSERLLTGFDASHIAEANAELTELAIELEQSKRRPRTKAPPCPVCEGKSTTRTVTTVKEPYRKNTCKVCGHEWTSEI